MIKSTQAFTIKREVGNPLNLFEKEWSQPVRILQTFLQLRKKEAEINSREVSKLLNQ